MYESTTTRQNERKRKREQHPFEHTRAGQEGDVAKEERKGAVRTIARRSALIARKYPRRYRTDLAPPLTSRSRKVVLQVFIDPETRRAGPTPHQSEPGDRLDQTLIHVTIENTTESHNHTSQASIRGSLKDRASRARHTARQLLMSRQNIGVVESCGTVSCGRTNGWIGWGKEDRADGMAVRMGDQGEVIEDKKPYPRSVARG
jgi:hypothetical protein